MTSAPTTTGASPAVGARGVVVGVVCGLGAVLAHALSLDGPVGLVTPAVVAVLGLALGPLLVRRPSPPRLLTGALTLQLLAHASMALGPMPPAHGPGSAGSPAAGAVAMVVDGGVPMLAGHLTIAAMTAVLARGADRALVSLLREWVEAVLLPRPAVGVVPTARGARVAVGRARPRTTEHRTTAGPRAPPGWRRTPAVPA